MFRRSFQCRSGCRSEGRSPTKWHIPKLPKTSEIAAAVPGILNEGSHNTTEINPPFFGLTLVSCWSNNNKPSPISPYK